MKILADYHHDSLFKSLHLLFEKRLGHELYRPVGLEWFKKGFWRINDLEDTAKQYLDLDQRYIPLDKTRRLNQILDSQATHYEIDGSGYVQKAVTWEQFLQHKWDFIIASVPNHIEPFRKLAEMSGAKFVIQIGNNWDMREFAGENVLASVLPTDSKGANACFYHQEIDLDEFYFELPEPNRKIYSFINVIENTLGWKDFLYMESMGSDFTFKSFGGQCRDGNCQGDKILADKMREAMIIFHVKPGGDGFGHVLHNAFAVGRPVITRKSHYKNQLGELLLTNDTCIDLDMLSIGEAIETLKELAYDKYALKNMSKSARRRFAQVVDYEEDAVRIARFLAEL